MGIHTKWFASTLLGDDGGILTEYSPATFARNEYGEIDHFTPSWIMSTTTYAGFTVVAVGASTLVMADSAAGVLQLTTSNVENEGIQMQTDGEIFLPAAGKDIWFEAKILSNDPTENDIFVGLCTTDTTIIASNPADVIGFWVHDGDANIDFEVSATAGGGAPVDTGQDLAPNVFRRVGFHVDGLSRVTPFIDGVKYAAATTVVNIPAVEMALSFAVLTGEGQINRLDLDYYRILQLK